MINNDEMTRATLKMELETLKSNVELQKQYVKELANAINGTGLCSGMSEARRRSIINDLGNHISYVNASIELTKKTILGMYGLDCK